VLPGTAVCNSFPPLSGGEPYSISGFYGTCLELRSEEFLKSQAANAEPAEGSPPISGGATAGIALAAVGFVVGLIISAYKCRETRKMAKENKRREAERKGGMANPHYAEGGRTSGTVVLNEAMVADLLHGIAPGPARG